MMKLLIKLITVIAFGILGACPGKDPRVINVAPGNSPQSPSLEINVEPTSGGPVFHVSQVPDDAELECYLDGMHIYPCRDEQIFEELEPGEHFLMVKAKVNGMSVAQGEHFFEYEPSKIPRLRSGIVVTFDDGYADETFAQAGQPLTIRFQVIARPDCSNMTLFCSLDRSQELGGSFSRCEGLRKHTIPSIALGRQSFQVKAVCGDRQSALKAMIINGVKDGYQWLSLHTIKFGDSYLPTLQRSSDCPQSLLTFECARNDQRFRAKNCPFTESGVLDVSAREMKIRARCRKTTGPEISIP